MKHGSLISPDEGSFGFGSHTSATVEAISTHGDTADFITVPDAHLLFSGEFKHSGNDLKIIGDDGKSFLVTDYFKNDKRPTLSSPDGATLSGDLVDLLAGPLAPGQYAQAGAPQAGTAEAVGRVAIVTGNVTIIRNGVAVTVNAGDAILKSDVVQTGAGATVGLSLNDGSTFNLTGNARLAINEFVYDPNGSANASLTTLIQGAATFVAGQIAKTGDMKVATPVATMGIRGTAVILDMNSVDGRVTISVVDERDNKDHSVEVFDRNGNLIATVVSNGGRLFLTPTATFEVIASFTNKTAEQIAAEFAAFQAVLATYGIAKQWFPNLPDRADLTTPRDTNTAITGLQPSDPTIGFGDPIPPGGPSKPIDYVITKNVETPGTDPDNNSTDPDNPTGPGEPVVLSSGVIKYGTIGNDTIEGTSGNDFIYAGAGDDWIVAGHGEGNDFYDGDGDNGQGFAGPGSDKITFHSTNNAITFDLVSITGQNTADGVDIGHDIFTNIERIVSGSGDDVFILHSADAWEIDAGGGFDTIKLAEGLNISAGEGPDVSNLEMVDLTYGGKHIVEFEGGGVDENNPNQVLRVVGDSQDVVILTHGDASGHWVKVGSPQTDVTDGEGGLFAGSDHHTDGVQFQEYEFVDNNGQVTASIYIDTNVTADIAPEVTLPPQTYLAFDGNDYAASAPASTQVENVTIEGWIRWDGTDTGHGQMLFYNGNTSTAGYGVVGDVVGDKLQLIGLAGGQNVMASDAYLSADEWHHVALVRVDEEFHLYVDGVEAGLANATSWVNDIITEDDYERPDFTMIGGNPTNSNEGFHGDIADVRLWDVARTEQEIADARFGSLDGDETGLAGYWPLTEGTGTSAPAHTPDGTSLEFNGAPLWTTGLNIDEDQTAKITDIQVVDPDAGDGPMQVKLSVAHGALELVDESDVSVQTDADGNITISGTLSDINAALATGVLFIPDANYNGPDSLHIVVTDADGGTSARDVAITLAPVDEAPVAPVLDLDADDSSGAAGADYQTAIVFGEPTAVLDSDATITDAATLNSATVQLTGEGFGGNTDYPNTSLTIDTSLLADSTGNGFSGSWHGISWQYSGGSSYLQLQITGNGSTVDYLQVLHAARMQFDSDTSNTAANVTVTVHSDSGYSNTATTAVDIPNRAPDINVFPFNSANETTDETDSPPSISKTLTIKDFDNDPLTVTVTGVTAEGTLGAHQATDFDGFLWVEAPASGNQYTWHFAPNNETFDYLNSGESLILHYTVHASDGSASDDQIINITINGTDEAPPPNEPPVANDDTLTGDLAGFTYNPDNGHWYKVSDVGDYKLWSDAQAAAIAAGGYLATITSLAENQFVLGLLTNVQNVWIGGSDSAQEGAWLWAGGPENGQEFWQGESAPTGVPLLYANWATGEPNNQSGEHFTILSPDGTWNDVASAVWDDAREYVIEVSFVEDHVSVIPGAFLLANDTDADGPTPSIYSVSVTDDTHGTVDLVNGNIVYTPDANYHGAVSFQYTVSDGTDVSAPATASFNVQSINDAPVIHTDAAYTDGDDDSTTLAGLLVTDADENPGEQYTVTAAAGHGTLSVSEGSPDTEISFHDSLQAVNNKLAQGITYTNGEDDPYTADDDNDTVTLTVTDANGGSDTINFLFKVFGEGGVSLTGGDQKDVLFGTGGNDTLEGGGNADTFVFDRGIGVNAHDIGFDQVTDFVIGEDKIDLGGGFASIPMTGGGEINFEAWTTEVVNGQLAIQQLGADTVIHLGENEEITLKGVTAGNLTANDFIIHPGA